LTISIRTPEVVFSPSQDGEKRVLRLHCDIGQLQFNLAGSGRPCDVAPTDSKYRLVILPARRAKQFTPIGLIPGQSLRYTFYNQNDPGSQPVRVRAYIYDATGRLLTQTDPVELRPAHAHTVEIKRYDLSVAGEEVMKRLQVRAGFQVALMDGSVRNVNIPAWLELVYTATGTTQGGSYYTGTVTVSSDGAH
jgi:hypothetical protein